MGRPLTWGSQGSPRTRPAASLGISSVCGLLPEPVINVTVASSDPHYRPVTVAASFYCEEFPFPRVDVSVDSRVCILFCGLSLFFLVMLMLTLCPMVLSTVLAAVSWLPDTSHTSSSFWGFSLLSGATDVPDPRDASPARDPESATCPGRLVLSVESGVEAAPLCGWAGADRTGRRAHTRTHSL